MINYTDFQSKSLQMQPLKEKLAELDTCKEIMWKQRSRKDWLCEVDNNTQKNSFIYFYMPPHK